MADTTNDLKARLSNLDASARLRVETALKEALDREIVLEAGNLVPGASQAAFSRGVLFSKSGRSVSLDDEILPALTQLDAEKFAAFTDRINALKGAKS